jgi:hypothetical protein
VRLAPYRACIDIETSDTDIHVGEDAGRACPSVDPHEARGYGQSVA